MTSLWFYARVVTRTAARERRVTALTIALVALAMAELVLATTWLQNTAAFGFWVVLLVVLCSALATTEAPRRRLMGQLRSSGASTEANLLVVVVQALLIGLAGTVLGLAVGSAARAMIIAIAPSTTPPGPTDLGPGAGGAVVAIVLAILWGGVRALRTGDPGRSSRPHRTRRWPAAIAPGLAIIGVALSVWAIADSSNFDNVELGMALFGPIIAIGATVLANTVLTGLRAALRTWGGTAWFVGRSLRTRARVMPVLAAVTISVGGACFAAVFTSSLHERVERATVELAQNPDAPWALYRPDGVFDFSAFANDPELRRQLLELGIDPGPVVSVPTHNSPTFLADTKLALHDPDQEWTLFVVALLAILPLVIVGVALNGATRTTENELLELQGAPGSFRRRANVIEAVLVALAGVVVGAGIGVGGTVAGIAIYNASGVETRDVTYPPVPITVPVVLILGLVMLVPLAVGLAAALATPRPRGRGLPWGQRVERTGVVGIAG